MGSAGHEKAVDDRVRRLPPTAADPVRSPAHWLHVLQRQVGNRVVQAAFGPRTALQRFVGKEHKSLGDSTGRMIDLGNGVVLSFGDLVALSGDEYRNLDDLMADTRTEEGKARLLAAIRDDHIPDPTHSKLPEPTAAQKSERFTTFLGLAAENPLHFNDSGQAIDTWVAQHTTAIVAALDAGLQNDGAARQLALAREGFAQHYLTDAFSGGHIRTPRPDIIGWYRANFGAAVADVLISQLSNRLIDGLVRQISPQSKAPDFLIRRQVSASVGKKLAAAIAGAGGRAKINDYFALGVAGVVSGAMHDLEGKRGVTVSSEAHPAPWVAFGDAQLGDSPVSREQAELAIGAAIAHLDRAYEIGRRHGAAGDRSKAPTVSYFGFDSAAVSPTASGEVTAVAELLRSKPEIQVTVTGHTDSTGSDGYNEGLGMKRAQSISQALVAGGARAEQIVTLSQGERAPVTTAPGQFRLNRRVTFDYVVRPGPYLDVSRDEATAEVAAALPPPYADVRRFVPKPLAAGVATPAEGTSSIAHAQVELENWRWGQIPQTLRGAINEWVNGYGTMLKGQIASEKALDDTTEEGYAIQPRPLVNDIVTDLLKDPAGFLERATGQQMSP